MDGGNGCFGWEAGVLREMGMEAGCKDAVAAAVRRVRAAFAQPAITSPWYPWPLGRGGGAGKCKTPSSMGTAAATAFPR